MKRDRATRATEVHEQHPATALATQAVAGYIRKTHKTLTMRNHPMSLTRNEASQKKPENLTEYNSVTLFANAKNRRTPAEQERLAEMVKNAKESKNDINAELAFGRHFLS